MDDAEYPPSAARPSPRRRGGHHYRAQITHLRRWPRRVLITANLLVFALIAVGVGAFGYAAHELGQIKRVHVAGLAQPSKSYVIIKGKKVKVADSTSPPFTVLLIGSDSRAGAVNSGLDVGNTTTNQENLSDSIILARVSPATHQVALLSIPRDLWVSVPGVGMGKINSAFAGGDPTRLIKVIESQIGIPVNHFAEVSFDSFEQIADAIGGVEQYFPTPAFDHFSGLVVPKAGCVLLKGAQALAFVRSREYNYLEPGQGAQPQEVPESDLGRIQRQQAFLKNAIGKMERDGDLTNPTTLASIVNAITKNLIVDSTFSDKQLVSLAEDFSHLDANAMPNTTYPVQNYNVDGTEALTGIPSADAAVVAQFESVGTVKAAATQTTKKASTSTTTVAPTTTVPADTIAVDVQNGSGVSGQAGQADGDLQSAGYIVSGTGDAANYSYGANVINYGADGLAAARTLQASLVGGATLTPDRDLSGTNLILTTGSRWNGMTNSGATPSSTSTAPTTTTTIPVPSATGTIYGSSGSIEADSSSYYHGTYIPPGREPSQKVETCQS